MSITFTFQVVFSFLFRVLLAISALVLLLQLSHVAVNQGVADLNALAAKMRLEQWKSRALLPNQTTWELAWNRMQTAMRLDANNPDHHETIARLLQWRLQGGDGRDGAIKEKRQQALIHLRQAVSLRPTWPYGWVNLALAKYRLDQRDDELYRAMANAITTGPEERSIQMAVAKMSLSLWNKAPKDLKSLLRGNMELVFAANRGEEIVIFAKNNAEESNLRSICPHIGKTKSGKNYCGS
ncbi:MAG: hypothetical protein HW380_52 [Magnetococcales bacterium]|nr:hypothetical protein [Magnetococcales bacterium]HIJ82712.1 hypothetical protein [Magnetococcales bacterium]